jgi:hypothetical protein
MGVSGCAQGVPDITGRESGPTGHPGYLRDIRDIRNQDQGWGHQVLSLISLIQHSSTMHLPVKSSFKSLAAFQVIMMRTVLRVVSSTPSRTGSFLNLNLTNVQQACPLTRKP